MPRVALVACLIVCLLLTGCASGRAQLASPFDYVNEQSVACLESTGRWLEDHPILKGCASCAMLVGAAALATAVVAVIVLAELHDH